MVFIADIAPEAAIRGEIKFASDNGFYPCLNGCHIKLNGAIHSAVVGYGQAVHP
ncbi:hypothetical protein ES703_123173 [subsurface metagenome]